MATLIHNSAIIGVIYWLIWDRRASSLVNMRYVVLMTLAAAFLFSVLPTLLALLANYIPSFSRYIGYVTTEVEGANRSFILRFLELLVFAILNSRLSRRDGRASFFLVACALCSVITLIGFTNAFAKRIGLYFQYPFSIFLFATCPKCFNVNSRLVVKYAIVIYQLLVFFISSYLLKQSDLIPYNFILSRII